MKELLKRLWQMRIIRYIPSNRSPMITFLTERLPRADLYISPESYKFRRELTLERFDRMLRYAENDRQCRSALMEAYFGVENPADCGVCDLCLERKRRQRRSDDLSGRILNLLEEGGVGCPRAGRAAGV